MIPEIDSEADDAEVAQMAVDARNAPQQEALASGHPVIVVEGDELVRIDSAGRTVLKKLPPWQEVTQLVKQISAR